MTNREILFKAKRIDNGEWIEGNLILLDDAEEGWEAIIIPTTDSNMYTKGGARGTVSFENWHRVNKDTICRYTGLTDTDGNKIWENDIVEYVHVHRTRRTTWIVEYSYGGFRLSDNNIDMDERIYLDNDGVGWGICKVIGNIFDNPELLDEKEVEQ